MTHPPTAGADPRITAALRDLHTPSPAIYWTDLLGSAVAGWTAFGIAVTAAAPAVQFVALVAATLLLYRAHLFIHELSHAARRIRGFAAVWNLLAGFPLLVPAFFAVGVHAHHHRPDTYGTQGDPEYLPFGRSRALILRFVLLTVLFPWLLAVRFLVLAPVALCVPPLQRLLERQASSLAMNPAFRRHVDAAEHRSIMWQQLALLVCWMPVVWLAADERLPLQALVCWAIVATAIALVNGIRTLGAHRYLGTGDIVDREAQREDSIDTPGRWWTTFWAPVGHRYHALHHHAPGLPYHNLGRAYRRLVALQDPVGAEYASAASAGLGPSLQRLWQAAGGTRVRDH